MKPLLTHRQVSFTLQASLIAEAVFALWRQNWPTLFMTVFVILLTLFPLLLEKRYKIFIPSQFQALAIVFVFASMYLGEVHGYYTRYWWWDIALHTSSGFLAGIIGLLLVHVLNSIEDIGLDMKPGFVAFFAFLFAVGMGVAWEIFEFIMDRFFGTNMQKPMLGDPSGLTDTMFDLIVDTLGAVVIAVSGYRQLREPGTRSVYAQWIDSVGEKNPQFFRRKD